MSGRLMQWRNLRSTWRHRPAETAAAVVAVALVVSFIAALGSFVAHTGSRLTRTAAAGVIVDWQVQAVAGQDPTAVTKAVRSTDGLIGYRTVEYARVPGLQSTSSDGTVRTTGSAYLVGLPSDYVSFAPGQLRPLTGTEAGPVLQQQTASNLDAQVGSTVQVLGSARPPQRITGVVDLPHADSFFQTVGSTTAATTASPDNVLLVPEATFVTLSAGLPVVQQFHVRLDHASLPADPAAAANQVVRRANSLTAASAGGAIVGDNLGAALSAAREDATYARLLVLVLGAPALLLSIAVGWVVIRLRDQRQRRDVALMRLRGATTRQIGSVVGLVAIADATAGAVVGVAGAALTLRLALGAGVGLDVWWAIAAVVSGLLVSVSAQLLPVYNERHDRLRALTSPTPPGTRLPWPLRAGLDVLLLGASGLVFWLTGRGGYQVVVAPEGVPVVSVNYAALLAPGLAWLGLGLLVWRLTWLALAAPIRLSADGGPRLGDLRRIAARRRRHLIARAATGLAAAVGVTVAAAVFTTTYNQQAHADVALTVGSDVAVTLPADSTATLDPAIAKVNGVRAVAPVAHRLAYVGSDLQDLYGIDATTIANAAPLQDAYTPGHRVREVLKSLAATHDGALLSQETLHDYQLRVGDSVRLKLRDKSGTYRPVSFHVVGAVTEFPTAPRDSFIVANREYLTQVTGRPEIQTLLVATQHPASVATRIVAPQQALVDNITAPRTAVTSASGLAAGSLSGLDTLVNGYGQVLAISSGCLVIVVGAVQRRRSLVMLAVIGADVPQRAGFIWTEARTVIVAGLLGGVLGGGVVAYELARILNGIFDPPPQHMAIPGLAISLLLLAVAGASWATTAISVRWAVRADPSRLRDL